MILTRLAEQFDRMQKDPRYATRLPLRGESMQKIAFEVILDPDGSLVDVADLRSDAGRVKLPQTMVVPGRTKPSGQGITPGFLWDNARYMLGLDATGEKPERTRNCFEAFRARHAVAARQCSDSGLRAVAAFLSGWSPELAAGAAWNDERLATGFGVFRLRRETVRVHESPVVKAFLLGAGEGDSGGVEGQCLATGVITRLARLHEPKIKGAGGQSAGTLLVSFNESAYESYGHAQSFNAPTGEDAVFRYTNALNVMLADRERTVKLGELRTVAWAEAPSVAEDVLADLFGARTDNDPDESEDAATRGDVRRLLTQLRDGVDARAVVPADVGATRFFVLGLAPNAARVVVQLWLETTVEDLLRRLGLYLREIAVDGASDAPLLSVWSLVRACGRAVEVGGRHAKYDAESVPPRLGADIARAVLHGGPYPQSWLNTLIGRLRADRAITHPRIAGIKACVLRNSRLRGFPMEVRVALDTGQTDEGYLMGRLFALLEKTQEDSSDGVNATIRDRFYASASATPAIVFPRLLRLCQHHLVKLAGGRKVRREQQLGEVMGKVRQFPHTLSLEAQGMFAIGYYHQRQALFTPQGTQETPADE